MNCFSLESFIFTTTPIACIEDGLRLPPEFERWLKGVFIVNNSLFDNIGFHGKRYDIFVLSSQESEKWDVVRNECLSSGSILVLVQKSHCTDDFFDIEPIDFSDGTSIVAFIPKVWVVNKVASYSYEDGSHREWPFPALVPAEENKQLVECADIADNGARRARAVNQFYEALKSQYTNIPSDFSFCSLGMPFQIDTQLSSIVSQLFYTGIIVETSIDLSFEKWKWKPSWLPKYMSDGSTTFNMTRDNSQSIKNFFSKKCPTFRQIENKYVISCLVIGKYIPSFGGCCAVAGFFLCPIKGISSNIWLYFIKNFEACLNTFILHDSRQRFQLSATKSAIGSIMSRNGSHNIGSHVLSALSHNVGTMPDDRVLYQYIQHRMDYIATVTTEFPTWTQPTMLVGELMRDFFSQRHLLDHIAESEGLSAWEFQNPDLSDDEASEQHEKIKLRIRHKTSEGPEDLINYVNKADKKVGEVKNLEKHDVALAIPGGIIGNHAFYTILENVIRNAAKHGWSKLPPTQRKEENLEVTIDYKDCGEYVEFTIWDDKSDLGEDKALLENQKNRMKQQFIDGEGRLRRENWGMAEIKISAGYLMGRSFDEIGGLGRNEDGQTSDLEQKENDWIDGIVEPCKVEEGQALRLGYKFNVKKPKDVVFVLNTAKKEQEELWNTVKRMADSFRSSGIVFLMWDEIREELRDKTTGKNMLAARYVVLPKFEDDEKCGPWPFRVLSWEKPFACKDMVAELRVADIRKALERNPSVRSLREEVEKAWLSHLIAENSSLKTNKFAMVVNTEAGESGGGRGLITNADVLRFVFANGLRTAVETFFETHSEKLSDDTAIALWALHASPPSKLPLIFGENDEVDGAIAWELLARLNALETEKSICLRLENSKKRLQSRLKDNFPSALNSMACPSLRERLKAIRLYLECGYRHPAADSCWVGNNTFPTWNEQAELAEDFFYQFQDGDKPRHEIAGFVRHLQNAFCEADVFLRKYEERIATLPAGFARSAQSDENGPAPDYEVCGIKIQSQSNPENSKAEALFYRHFRPASEALPDGMIYQEPLSGTQSYFNAIAGMAQSSGGNGDGDVWVAKMAECALLKICVADERVAKFLRDHPTVRNTYGVENIRVLDDKWVEGQLANQDIASKGNSSSKEPRVLSLDDATGLCHLDTNLLKDACNFVRNLEKDSPDPPSDDWIDKRITQWVENGNGTVYTGFRREVAEAFDILILHQGLIDKWLGERSHSKGHVAVFLGILKLYVKYVVITTGRGTPANIPPRARVLPFPTLESALFRMYPEKLILVDTILNILPVGEQPN